MRFLFGTFRTSNGDECADGAGTLRTVFKIGKGKGKGKRGTYGTLAQQ